MDLLRTLTHGPRTCPSCGAQNFRDSTHCHSCGERLINKNPFVRFLVTVAAVGVIALVVWWKLKR